jgi:hydroxymethylpyrimidine/phosphomethylpyrimidine kinase
VALTIAGSDSGGGAGLQADLKAFAALGVHGTSAVTAVTAQNPVAVTGVEPLPARFVVRQIEAVFAELPPRAAKTGMLFNREIIRAVARFFRAKDRPPLVVDPVMIATSGARLLRPDAEAALRKDLLPLATVITPNLDEAATLLGRKLEHLDDLRSAARELADRFGVPVLAKGGHLRNGRDAVDVLWDGRDETLLRARFVRGVATHGTGCIYSAAIAGYLALGCSLVSAVTLAKRHVTQAIAQSLRIGRHTTLNHGWV